MVLQPVPRDGAPAHAAWRAWWRVSPAPRPTTTVPAADPAGRPDLTEKEASRLMLQFRKLVGDHHPHAPHPGRIRVPGRPRRGHSARKELLATPCQPIKGVTILPFGFGKHKVPVRRLPATMNKYGFLASVGRAGVCHVQRRSRYHSTPPAQERTRQPAGSTTPEEKQSKIVASWIEH